jgi:hypothetical protein
MQPVGLTCRASCITTSFIPIRKLVAFESAAFADFFLRSFCANTINEQNTKSLQKLDTRPVSIKSGLKTGETKKFFDQGKAKEVQKPKTSHRKREL